jgi:threonylcarbamoyladenosine tRNA methylthiotransferase MtaB
VTVEVLTFGCRLNAYESAVIRDLAERAVVDGSAAGQPDTVVVNTCAVTAEAERQCRKAIRRVHRDRPGARIVATGCAVQLDPAAWAALPGVDRVLGNAEKLRPESWAPGAPPSVSDIMAVREHAPHLATGFDGRARAFVEVQQGCGHRCTFCIIPFARGPSRSVPLGGIVQQVRTLVAAGYKEVVLTGVDISSYGADLPGGPPLGAMARRLLALVPELPRLRLSSLDPAAIDPALWGLIADEPRLMPHLHLSVQAGSDLILKRMRRRHGRDAALGVIDRARMLRPGIAIGADLIAGFPTETDALFRDTLAFVDEAALPYLHVFAYSERPGTPAARMPAVPDAARRERAAQLRAAAVPHAAAFHAGLVGRTVQVVAERGGRGHTEHFAPIRLAQAAPPGALLEVRVAAASAAGLHAAGA